MKRKTSTIVMLLLFLICFLFINVGYAAAEGEENRLFDEYLLSRRDEMVQMAGYGEEKLSTVLILGSVNCEATFQFHREEGEGEGDHQPPHAWPIPGASVGAYCHSRVNKKKSKSMVARGVTDEFGDFMVDLPSNLHTIPNLEKICTVRVRRIPKESLCKPVVVKKHKGLKLSSFGNGIRTYTAGNIRLQHSKKGLERKK